MDKRIFIPASDYSLASMGAGDRVLLCGVIYTARDAAHKRMVERLSFDIKGQIIYYAGPTPAPPGRPIGSCGPTTSARMDGYTPLLLKMGLKGMIGKGSRSDEVVKAIRKYKAIYFIAIGGAGALLSKKIKSAEIVAYKDLGPEAIYKLEVEDFPVVVGIDSRGRSIFKKGREVL